jgi:hypothetical protein
MVRKAMSVMKKLRLLFVIWVCVLTPAVARAEGGWLDWLYSMDNRFLGYASEVNVACKGSDTSWQSFCGESLPTDLAYLVVGKKNKITHKVSFDKVRHEIDLRVAGYHTAANKTTGSMTAWEVGGSYHWHVPKAGWLEPGASVSVIHFNGGDWVQSVSSRIDTVDVKLVPGGRAEFHIELSHYSHGLTGAAAGPDGKVTFKPDGEGNRVTIGLIGWNFWR